MDKIKFTLGMFSFPDFFATNCNCCPFYFLFISGKFVFFQMKVISFGFLLFFPLNTTTFFVIFGSLNKAINLKKPTFRKNFNI
jgi:hypothetical protein